MIMLPWKFQYRICWCILILCGYHWSHVLSHGLGLSKEQVNRLHGLSDHHPSLLSGGTQASAIKSFQKSRFSSQIGDFVTCGDLDGVGSFDTTCLLNSNTYRDTDIYVVGAGNLEILPNVEIACLIEGCTISFNLSGNAKVGKNTTIIAGTVIFSSASLTMEHNSSLNTSSLGGSPPPQTSGTPVGYDGSGGGHGGRGSSCLKTNNTNFWGGDVYGWSSLSYPWEYGSKGGGTSNNHKTGGSGGGRVLLDVNDVLYINGSVLAEGGHGGSLGGGGSGGSIILHSQKLMELKNVESYVEVMVTFAAVGSQNYSQFMFQLVHMKGTT